MHEVLEQKIKIEDMIYEIRGKQVMLDSDVARLFGYETKNLNRSVKNNIDRFPDNYCFQLTSDEYKSLRCNFFTLKNGRGEHSKYLPYVFTEYGITMLAGILKSDVAVKMSIRIVNAFVAMRKYISQDNYEKRISNLETQYLEHENKFDEIFSKLQSKNQKNEIFFDGQIYDAYSKIVDIIMEAKENIIIIDSYADKKMLDVISRTKVNTILITRENKLLKKLDIEKYYEQYTNLKVIYNNTFHDRYFILDNSMVYHCGASFNHIGEKTFSINRLEDLDIITVLIDKISKIVH